MKNNNAFKLGLCVAKQKNPSWCTKIQKINHM
jgi:hypothetical protein